jgi:fatty acid desaturase
MWKVTRWDALLLGFSLVQFGTTLWLAFLWNGASLIDKCGAVMLVAIMMIYNIIVVSHLFTHVPWFEYPSLNSVTSMVNSVNICQSVQVYQFTHVRNHHRYNNDKKGPGGSTRDVSSTFRRGENGEHAPVLSYVVTGVCDSLMSLGKEVLSARRLWRVGSDECGLLAVAARSAGRRRRELRQVQLDRAVHCAAMLGFALISWRWALLGYLPAVCIAFGLVNLQNYYRHYGARPGDRNADSVSYYGRLYNIVTFNDGYHQEHHLNPRAHWSQLPMVREKNLEALSASARIVSPVPAMLGFLHRQRPLLHREEYGHYDGISAWERL